jgi:hypothetical protein
LPPAPVDDLNLNHMNHTSVTGFTDAAQGSGTTAIMLRASITAERGGAAAGDRRRLRACTPLQP